MTTLQTLEVTEAQLGQLVGRSDRTIRRWIKDGHLQRVAPGRLLLADALPAVVARIEEASDGSELAQERLRKLRADATMSELELARQRGLVAPVQQFADAQFRFSELVKQNMLQLPSRLCIRLLNEADESRFRAAVKEEVTTLLSNASTDILRVIQQMRDGETIAEQDPEE